MAERNWTYEDLLRLPFDGMRHEILDGVHYVTDPHYTKEQRVVAHLKSLLHYSVRDTFFYDRRLELTAMGMVDADGHPEFLINVLPQWKTAFRLMPLASVVEYWLVHPALNSVEVHRRGRVHTRRIGDTLTTPFVPGFSLPLRELFAM